MFTDLLELDVDNLETNFEDMNNEIGVINRKGTVERVGSTPKLHCILTA